MLAVIGKKRRIIVTMPPRHGKSELISHWFIVWFLHHFPNKRIILCTYGGDFAEEWGKAVRKTLEKFSDLLGVTMLEDKRSGRWQTDQGGGMLTTGVGGDVTGRGGDVIVIDDPFKNAEEAKSPVVRDRVWNWFDSTLSTREQPFTKTIIIIVHTRWNEDDLIGRLIERQSSPDWEGEVYEVVNFPAIAEENDVLDREPGDPLWPEAWPLEELLMKQATHDDWTWQALFQQHPTTPGGSVFKREWWDDGRNRYHIADVAGNYQVSARYLSLDPNWKPSDNSAYASIVCGELSGDYALRIRNVWRGRPLFTDLVEEVISQAKRWNHDGKLRGIVIEEKASGASVIQTLRAQAPEWMVGLIIPYNPAVDKTVRARQAAVWCRNNCILFPHPSNDVAWMHDFTQEILRFPTSNFMDQVDAFSQLIIYLEHYISDGFRSRVGYSAKLNDDDEYDDDIAQEPMKKNRKQEILDSIRGIR